MADNRSFSKILVIQNAFIGDAILGTGVLEKLHAEYPQAEFYYLVRKDASALFENHPFIKGLFIFNRKEGKWKELFRLSKEIRAQKFDLVITLQRFGSSGYLTWRSGARVKCGFSKNPFSFCFTHKIKHVIGDGTHETQRNQQLISSIASGDAAAPKLYPAQKHYDEVSGYVTKEFITISPASVWFTKRWPAQKWIELINATSASTHIYLMGGPGDTSLCDEIKKGSSHPAVSNLAGSFSFLATAALMQKASMNFTNDSAPLHICSAMRAPVTAVFCSTVPEFGFGPVNTNARIVQVKEKLDCRPCGIHGHKSCPKGHFKCALEINAAEIAD